MPDTERARIARMLGVDEADIDRIASRGTVDRMPVVEREARALYDALRAMHDHAMKFDRDYPGTQHEAKTRDALARYEKATSAR